jgi:NADPH-dependent glutamate synthase beta subunit-like oxidoreductase
MADSCPMAIIIDGTLLLFGIGRIWLPQPKSQSWIESLEKPRKHFVCGVLFFVRTVSAIGVIQKQHVV